MPLMTRCPHCQTVFRITPEQLRAHGGQVRCGRCLQIFNGLETLVPDAPAPAVAEATMVEPAQADTVPFAAVVETVATEGTTETIAEHASAAGAGEPAPEVPDVSMAFLPEPPAPIPEESAAGGLPGETVEEAVEEKAEAGPEAEAEMQTAIQTEGEAPAAPPVEAPAGNPFMQQDDVQEGAAMPANGQRRRPWLLAASVLLALALGAQAVYFYRGDIAARHPLARQWLNAACARLACTVPLPQLPKSVLIEASDLQLVDPARPERIQLTATLRNHAGHAVGYPALDLVLTNANDHTLARRIFLPAEYLGGGRDPHGGLAANAELTVRLALDTGDLGAAGFRLAVLAAPR
ncbi:MAG: zinc-ribbon domain-containing protein [Burkholderiales bacterium]|nr:zinc-ribbon domain-containing protein [Burkholderiales bacterium]